MIPTDACELMTTLTAAAAVSTGSTASQKGEWKSFEMEKEKKMGSQELSKLAGL